MDGVVSPNRGLASRGCAAPPDQDAMVAAIGGSTA
jgi:hypothetical protein